MITDLERGIGAYMRGRCGVRSQHQLPTLAELQQSTMGRYAGENEVAAMVNLMVEKGKLRRYGPYLSDREINVP